MRDEDCLSESGRGTNRSRGSLRAHSAHHRRARDGMSA